MREKKTVEETRLGKNVTHSKTTHARFDAAEKRLRARRKKRARNTETHRERETERSPTAFCFLSLAPFPFAPLFGRQTLENWNL